METRLTWNEFCSDISELKNASDTLDDGWLSKGDFSECGRGYLSKIVRRRIAASATAACEDLEDAFLKEDFAEEGTAVSEMVTFEYHLLYSLSFEVPVLYFNAWHSNGSLLDIEQIWDLASVAHKGAVRDSKWNAVSQQDHPLLGTPFFFFHPCNSANLLGDLTSPDTSCSNRILAWLSVVGPILGLRVPIDYVKEMAKERLSTTEMLS